MTFDEMGTIVLLVMVNWDAPFESLRVGTIAVVSGSGTIPRSPALIEGEPRTGGGRADAGGGPRILIWLKEKLRSG